MRGQVLARCEISANVVSKATCTVVSVESVPRRTVQERRQVTPLVIVCCLTLRQAALEEDVRAHRCLFQLLDPLG